MKEETSYSSNQKKQIKVGDSLKELELICPENAEILCDLLNSDSRGEVYHPKYVNHPIFHTENVFVGWDDEDCYWYLQIEDTKILVNKRCNADLIAKIFESDNHYEPFYILNIKQ